VNEYEEELQALKAKLEQLRIVEAPPEIIEEHEFEIRNLEAIYRAAQHTYALGSDDSELQLMLAEIGYGEWKLSNVYSFVYDAAMDAEVSGEELAHEVDQTDYAASLRLAGDS
jgi:hypothetical protein